MIVSSRHENRGLSGLLLGFLHRPRFRSIGPGWSVRGVLASNTRWDLVPHRIDRIFEKSLYRGGTPHHTSWFCKDELVLDIDDMCSFFFIIGACFDHDDMCITRPNSSLQNRLVHWPVPPLYKLFSRILSIRCGTKSHRVLAANNVIPVM